MTTSRLNSLLITPSGMQNEIEAENLQVLTNATFE